jgi:predicted transcriptional regulator
LELYGTFLDVLALKEIETAKEPLSVADIRDRFIRFQPDDRLESRLRCALDRVFDSGLVTKEMVQVKGLKHAYVYSLTDDYFEKKKFYELD